MTLHIRWPGLLIFTCAALLTTSLCGAQESRTVPPSTLEALLGAPQGTRSEVARTGDVTIVEYFDYNCPACRALEPQLRKLLAADSHLHLIRKDWPIFGDGSVYAAYCSFAASAESVYSTVHGALIRSKGDLATPADVLATLRAAGIDVTRIQGDIARNQKTYDEVLARTRSEAQSLGLRGTPGLIVGNQLVIGGADYRQLRNLIARVRQRS
jgi:protein-disulfide isomerase